MTLNPADHQVEHPAPTLSAGNLGGTTHVSTASQFSYPRRDQYHASQQSPAWSGTDWCAPENAYRLAARIKDYWAKRGKQVNLQVMDRPAGKGTNQHHHAIRSDMVSGWPRPSHPMVRP